MTPETQAVYSNYTTWFEHLLQACQAICALPLEDMLSANIRMTLAGTYLGEQGREQVNPVGAARQRALIERTITFRDAFIPPGDQPAQE